MHGYTTDVLTESLSNSRLRTLAPTSRELHEAEVSIETADLLLAVKSMTRKSFVRPPTRETLAQMNAETNLQPLPLVRRTAGPPPLPTDTARRRNKRSRTLYHLPPAATASVGHEEEAVVSSDEDSDDYFHW